LKRLSRLFFIGLILVITNTAFAVKDEPAPSIKTSISRKRILVGDRIRYKTEIFSRLDLEIDFPRFKDNKLGECEIKDSGKEVKGSFFGGRKDYINWLDITSYYIGKRTIPPIEIKYREKGQGNWKALKTGELSFTVESVLPRNMRLYDIKDIKGPIYPFSILQLLGYTALAFISLWLIIKLLKKLKKKAPPKLPHEAAIEALEAARAEFIKTADIKEYYVKISDIVRHYIEIVFKVRAPEMTTQEFLSSLGTSWKASGDHKELLMTFMEACDLVKFAKHAPSKEEAGAVLTTAKKFIEGTKGEDVHI